MCMALSFQWFQSYVSDRTKTVQVKDAYSNIENITCGVSQGSILGLLFSSVMSTISR